MKKKKIRDIVNYGALSFNPFIMDDSIAERLNGDDFDITLVDHRRRHQLRLEKQREREELARSLGVDYKPKLTPIEEILQYLPKTTK